MLIKPPIWNWSPGLVAPEWRCLLRGLEFVAMPWHMAASSPLDSIRQLIGTSYNDPAEILYDGLRGLKFDYSSGDYVSWPTLSIGASDPFAMDALVWVPSDATYGTQVICGVSDSGGNMSRAFALWTDDPNLGIDAAVITSGAARERYSLGYDVPRNRWLHFAMSHSGGAVAPDFWLEGSYISNYNTGDGTNVAASGPVKIGADPTYPADMAVALVRVWKRQLLSSEVSLLASDPLGMFGFARQIPLPLMYRHTLRGRR